MKASDRNAGIPRGGSVFSVNGYYGKRIAQGRSLWLWSAALALLCTLVSYPGIWYSDSYVRVATGGAVLNAVVKTLTGHRFPLDTGNAFSVTPSFFMAASLGVTGHVALYTFAQAFAFFAAVFLLIRELNPAGRKLQSALFAVCPLVYGMSVYYEAGIGCFAGIAALILLFRRAGVEKSRGDRALEFLLVAFASFVAFGYRTNALTVIPVLVFCLFRLKAEKAKKALVLLALVCGILFTKALPWVFDIRSQSTATSGLVWEMLTVIQRMDPEAREEYRDYLDEIGGEGSTRKALAASNEATAGSFMWGGDLGIGKMSAPGATAAALKKYAGLIAAKPLDWLRVKRDFVLRAMGVGHTLDYSEYNYNRWDQMADYGFNDSLQRHAFYDSFMGTCAFLGAYTLHPWLPFLISLVMVVAEAVRKSARRGLYAAVLWTAAFYYLAYLLDTPAFDFRYFYPSLLLMMILQGAVLLDWIRIPLRKLRARRS